jgi:BirA family biotin operon repressor/biotin-[acetyl-CoA-carboxylase] ligase
MAIDPADLAPWLRTRWLGRSSTYHAEIDSTQDEARRLASHAGSHGHLVWAGSQRAGRGRMRRHWHSPPGSGLFFSVVLLPRLPAAALGALPLAAGAAVGSALDGLVPGHVRLKWPNDVLLDGGKVAGILVEAQVTDGLVAHAVIGVGINLSRPAGDFDPEIRGRAAALDDVAGAAPPAARILAVVLGALEAGYEELIAEGPGRARRRWLQLADTIGREVTATANGRPLRGRAVDLDEGGNLVLEVEGERVVIAYGEIEQVTLREG